MTNISVSDKKKRHAQEVSRYMKKCTRAYQFVRNLHRELEKENLYLTIPMSMYNKELLGKYWRFLPDFLENKLELIEGKKKSSEAQDFLELDKVIEKITPSGEEEEITNVQP